jgi:hypothetical protein
MQLSDKQDNSFWQHFLVFSFFIHLQKCLPRCWCKFWITFLASVLHHLLIDLSKMLKYVVLLNCDLPILFLSWITSPSLSWLALLIKELPCSLFCSSFLIKLYFSIFLLAYYHRNFTSLCQHRLIYLNNIFLP